MITATETGAMLAPTYEELMADYNAVRGELRHQREQKRKLSEQIAQAIGPMIDAETSDMDLPELVAALIDFALGEHARAQAISMEPEDAPGVFLVLNADGRITGPVHKSDRDARAYAQQYGRSSSSFTVVRRVATCTARIETDWKEG